jgi:hypothetical protein
VKGGAKEVPERWTNIRLACNPPAFIRACRDRQQEQGCEQPFTPDSNARPVRAIRVDLFSGLSKDHHETLSWLSLHWYFPDGGFRILPLPLPLCNRHRSALHPSVSSSKPCRE